MKKVDNFIPIMDLLEFRSDDDFYFLQILQRKKENPHLSSNSRVVKNYYIKSRDHLLFHSKEIIDLCDAFNARAMFRLNRRSWKKVAFKTLQLLANQMANGEFDHTKNAFTKACGQGHNDNVKKWIIDIDYEGEGVPEAADLRYMGGVASDMIEVINMCSPDGPKLVTFLPSKSGFHLITTPFNTHEFGKMWGINLPDIHKDNPTNLYIP